LFGQFAQMFEALPCVLIKGYAQLLGDEIASYSDPSRGEPDAIVFTPFGDEGNQLSNLPYLLETVADERQRLRGALNYSPSGMRRRRTRSM